MLTVCIRKSPGGLTVKERKYKEDYALETYMDARGRERQRAVYRGKWYALDREASRAAGRFTGLCAAAFAVCYVIYVKMSTPSAYCMYVLPVSACALIPLIYWVMGVYAMLRAPAAMTRLQSETGPGRVLRSSVSCAVLMGMACVGDLIYMLVSLGSAAAGEAPGFAMLLCAAASAYAAFRRAKEAHGMIRETAAPQGGEGK